MVKIDQGNGIIITGDFNAHYVLWNCKGCDYNGEMLLKDMEDKNLYIVNKDTKSRIGNIAQKDSNLDLMFCSADMIGLIEYQQMEDPWDSDHFPIEFHIGINIRRYKKRTTRITNKKTK